MDAKHLSKRMQAVADLVPKVEKLADIGSDHAYLPAYLLNNQVIDFAIAGEVVKGPFENAVSEIEDQNLTGKMEARLGDGLEVIKKQEAMNVITIAGMGGELITSILDEGQTKLNQNTILILQPNVDENTLRKWLVNHHFKITAEKIVLDSSHFYEMFKAEYTDDQIDYSQVELDFGPFLVLEQSETFKAKWQAKLEKNKFILNKLENSNLKPSEKIKRVKNKIIEIEEVLNGKS
ncbi:tRNA (adenine(22)-N(1))-methyltransferase TrmK [Fructilactobacillus vespulae]|uniref:tRNA (adenine(22)-N(1))-methyltransferase n=1 Tax=Fructilactobacillus vespulae TaxID=1249630 RepID=UPI0039B689A1